MAKVKFKISVEVEIEDGSVELQRAVEYSAAQWQEQLEHSVDQHTAELQAKYPECKFNFGQDDEGEEWKG